MFTFKDEGRQTLGTDSPLLLKREGSTRIVNVAASDLYLATKLQHEIWARQ